jgi:hypothetical protein
MECKAVLDEWPDPYDDDEEEEDDEDVCDGWCGCMEFCQPEFDDWEDANDEEC